ncbi:MAG: Cell shape-determining protein MreC [uncultured bacterium]|nr:MAG: Cell shape-determining protein MreC [uncultured bacterium]
MRYYSFKKTSVATVTIFFLIIFAHYLGMLKFIETKVQNTFSSTIKYFSAQTTNVTPNINIAEFNNKIDILSAKNKLLEQENFDLRNQLNFKSKNKYNILTASIIAKNLEATDRVIVIDKGLIDGVRVDQPVIYGDGILIGKIFKTEDTLSFARILSDNQSKVAATILNSDHSLGVIEGGFGLSVKMTFIPRNENIMIGDQIITSGLEMNLPRGLVIGKVAAIENEAYQPFQSAIIDAPVDYEKINLIGIILQ